ncbi:hypothetical protein KQX54_017339 [Cotesia glomerata]|uniref:Uncharacterized protein n=1 Tax=Cotesia glomerata TaxID=32391 RepID=A0AAV7IBD1_COTGL|nr:hypothetical protein KQX54_017339 [Cotesia glomerata]
MTRGESGSGSRTRAGASMVVRRRRRPDTIITARYLCRLRLGGETTSDVKGKENAGTRVGVLMLPVGTIPGILSNIRPKTVYVGTALLWNRKRTKMKIKSNV